MKIRTLLIIALYITSYTLSAQSNFKPGYIITNSKDTIYGEIDLQTNNWMSEECIFKQKNNKSQKYLPNDIFGFRFINGRFYISESINNKPVFLEFLIKGKVNIYYLKDRNRGHYYISKKGERISELPYKEYVKTIDNKEYLYKSKRHILFLKYYMKDAPEIENLLNGFGEPRHSNLINLAKSYHNSVCDEEKCIIYEKKTSTLTYIIEAIGGFSNFTNRTVIEKKPVFQTGVIINISIPRLNYRLFFRTGILYSSVTISKEYKKDKDLFEGKDSATLITIPIMCEYIFPKYFIRPKIAFGINIHKPIFQSVAFMTGVNIHITNNIFISLNYDVDMTPKRYFPIVPIGIISHSFTAGLSILL